MNNTSKIEDKLETEDNLSKFHRILEISEWLIVILIIISLSYWSLFISPIFKWPFNLKLAILFGLLIFVFVSIFLNHILSAKKRNTPQIIYLEGIWFATSSFLYFFVTTLLNPALSFTGTTYFALFIPLMVFSLSENAILVIPISVMYSFYIFLGIIYDYYWGPGYYYQEFISHPIALITKVIFILFFAFLTRYLAQEAWNQRKARNRLEQLDKQRSIFVEIIAHELRTPITAMKGYLSLLEDKKEILDSETIDFINKINVNFKNLDQTIEKLFKVSELESKTWLENSQPTNFNSIVRQALDSLQPFANEKQVILLFESNFETILVKINQEYIRLALSKLIDNGIKYNHMNGFVKIITQIKNRELIGKIIDNGRGIPSDEISHIFTKFYQVPQDNSILTSRYPGVGISLYISKLIFQQHDGDIQVESNINHGTTFTFTLPVFTND